MKPKEITKTNSSVRHLLNATTTTSATTEALVSNA
jgi:hypothetical protein